MKQYISRALLVVPAGSLLIYQLGTWKMDSPIPAAAGPATVGDTATNVMCPFDGRRSAKEVWVKLFVVHFSTIALFCHVLSIRGERIVSWKLVFYMLVPFNLFASHGIALSVAFLAMLYVELKNKPPYLYESLSRAPRWFLGLVPRESAFQRVPTADLNTIGGADDTQERWKRFGRIIVAAGILVQCITAIALYVRRQKRDAVTHADQRVFKLASTGVVSAIYCIGIEARLPLFGQPSPSIATEERTMLDTMMVWLRDTVVRPLMSENVRFPHGESFVRNLMLCTVALEIQAIRSGQELEIFSVIWALESIWQIQLYWFSFLCLVAVVGLCVGQSSLLCLPVGSPLLLGVLLLAHMCFVSPWMMPAVDLVKMTTQLTELEHWPTDAPCPLLWVDPVAPWMWALA